MRKARQTERHEAGWPGAPGFGPSRRHRPVGRLVTSGHASPAEKRGSAMAHDHAVSKTEGKSAGVPGRGKAGSHLRSGARSVLNLQNAAGNRAVARMLTEPASDVSATAAVAPVSVQRDELVDALKREMGGQEVDFRQLAQTLLRNSEALAKGPMTPVKENKLAVKDKQTGATTTTTTVKKLRTAGLAGAGPLTLEELEKREKELRRPLTRGGAGGPEEAGGARGSRAAAGRSRGTPAARSQAAAEAHAAGDRQRKEEGGT